MSRVALALYRGPTGRAAPLQHRLAHWAICLRTLSGYSHAELVIDGVCHSSSWRDGGVRARRINLASSRWTVVPVPGADADAARAWFDAHMGARYDWPGILSFISPVRHHKDRWFCFEAVGAALGLPRAHRQNGRTLLRWALQQQTAFITQATK